MRVHFRVDEGQAQILAKGLSIELGQLIVQITMWIWDASFSPLPSFETLS